MCVCDKFLHKNEMLAKTLNFLLLLSQCKLFHLCLSLSSWCMCIIYNLEFKIHIRVFSSFYFVIIFLSNCPALSSRRDIQMSNYNLYSIAKKSWIFLLLNMLVWDNSNAFSFNGGCNFLVDIYFLFLSYKIYHDEKTFFDWEKICTINQQQ